MPKKYALSVSMMMVVERIKMLLKTFEPPFQVSDLYRIHRGAFVTAKDGSIDYETAINYLDKTNQIRILERKEPFSETIFEPTTDFGVRKPTVPVALPTIAKSKIASDAGFMLEAYASLYIFENSVRDFIEGKLKQGYGDNWWGECAPSKVKKNVEERKQDKRLIWHSIISSSPLMLTDFADLANIIAKNWKVFKETLHDLEKIRIILSGIEIPRNIIAHSNPLTPKEKTIFEQNVSTVLKLIDA